MAQCPTEPLADRRSRQPEADCPVCWNPFNNTFRTPKLLECRHSFCIECLAHLSLVSPTRNRLQCPLCRHPTVLPSSKPVTELPTNTAVLRWLKLEPNHIILEGRQLYLKHERKARYCLRQPRVYTLNLGTELSSSQAPSRPSSDPSRSALQQRLRNPQVRVFAYLMGVILGMLLLLLFSLFWAKQFPWGVG
ncbi:E3 ubiquitin-protein ligase RNF183 [Carettochelys insculpta]|uniref:E3 ubiquitin-protein ligase RNF183 n=1 Tax=Carettochelys insculpta TaxID=44489 RepID=UPI003EB8C245